MSEIDKLLILNEKLKLENIKTKEESRELAMKVTRMKDVMMEYDLDTIEQQTSDKVNIFL